MTNAGVDAASDAVTTGGRRALGQAAGNALGPLDFVLDPFLAGYFFEENLDMGETLFGEDSWQHRASGRTFSKSELVYLLVAANREQEFRAPGADLPGYYAKFFYDRYL